MLALGLCLSPTGSNDNAMDQVVNAAEFQNLHVKAFSVDNQKLTTEETNFLHQTFPGPQWHVVLHIPKAMESVHPQRRPALRPKIAEFGVIF